MQIIRYPKRDQWRPILRRPANNEIDIAAKVRSMINDVKAAGDEAVRQFTRQFDGVEIDSFLVDGSEFVAAEQMIPEQLKRAMRTAKANIERFHSSQIDEPKVVET